MPRKARAKITKASPKTLDMGEEIREVCRLLQEKLPPAHGNRQLEDHMVLGCLLCAFFEPACRSLRTIDELSTVGDVQELSGADRLARSTLSDALRRFETSNFSHVVRILKRRLPDLKQQDPKLSLLVEKIMAADGSSFRMAGEVAWALKRRRDRDGNTDSQAKVHLQLDVRRWTMEDIRVTGTGRTPGGASEQSTLGQMLQADVIYLLDRGYCGFELIGRILEVKSHFVLRLKKDLVFRAQQELPLTEEDRQAGIETDQVGLLGKPEDQLSDSNPRDQQPPQQILRLVKIRDPLGQHDVLLLTDLRPLEARIIGYLYRCRWIIELFWRWLKVTAGFAHLLSESVKGVETQMYVAMIGTLLIYLHTQLPVSKYSLFALSMVASGRASYEDMLPAVLRLERERALERARLARKRAEKKNV